MCLKMGSPFWGEEGLVFPKSKSHYDRRSVGQSVLVSRPIWVSWPDINFCLTFTFFVDVGRPFWREVGSVICISHLNCFSSVILLLAIASYFTSDCLWFAFFTSKRHKPSHHVKIAVNTEYLIWHGPHRKHRVQQLFYCWVCIRCRGNAFTELLLSNGPG
jgi:hypothetical protein